MLATDLRDMLERSRFGNVKIENSAIATDTQMSSVRRDFETKMSNLTPNEQCQGRTLSRTIWSVSKKEFESNHIVERSERATVRSNTPRTGNPPALGGDYFLDDDDDEVDELSSRPTLDTDDRLVSTPSREMRNRTGIAESGAGNEVDESPLDLEGDHEDFEDKDLSYVESRTQGSEDA